MVDAAPFRALRYVPSVTGDPAGTSAPAYDEFDAADYARHRTVSPYTVLELLAPPSVTGYDHAAAAFRRWQRTGVLRRDPEPAFYGYEQRAPRGEGRAGWVQRSLLAAVRVEPLEPGAAIAPHEDVDAERVRQRLARLAAVPAELTPVFTIAPTLPAPVHVILDEVLTRPPLADFVDEVGVRHRVAATTRPAEVAALQHHLRAVRVVVADGHHRYAAAVVRRQRGEPQGERTLLLVADAHHDGPYVLPVHRLLREFPADWGDRLAPVLAVTPAPAGLADLTAALAAEPAGAVGLRLPGSGFMLRPRDLSRLRATLPRGASPEWRALDAALVEHALLPLLGVDRDKLAHRAGPQAAEEVDRGEAAALLALRPPEVTTVLTLALRGERMPAKTTSFRPKPRTGLVMRRLAP